MESENKEAINLRRHLRPEDIADAVLYMIPRDRRIAVNEMLVRAGAQTL